MSTLQDRIRAQIAAKAKAAPPPPPTPQRIKPVTVEPEVAASWSQFTEAIPSVTNGAITPRDESELAIDARINSLGVIEAYRLYIHKMEPDVGSKTESIMISCPMPHHKDSNPSAWMNSDKDTWFCGTCQTGGDKIDLAAIGHGYDLDTYKTDGTFPKLRREMAADLGLTVEYVPGLGYEAYEEPTLPARTLPPVPEPSPDQPALPLEDPAEPEPYAPEWDKSDRDTPSLDWRKMFPKNTFLDAYMRATIVDDVPEEYHFWHAMLALSLATGRQCFLEDDPIVWSNFFVVLMGSTGIGKSKAKRYMTAILNETSPYDGNSPTGSSGVRLVAQPGSAEAMVASFQHPIRNSVTNPKAIAGYAPVRGMVEFPEFKGIVQRIGRTGNTLVTTLIEFYDSGDVISRHSISGGLTVAQEPHCCVLSTVQPEVLKDLLKEADEDSGFLNRWLFVGGPAKKKRMFNEIKVVLTEPIDKMRNIVRWSDKKHKVKFTDGAKKMLTDAWESYIQADVKASGNAFSRIDLTIKKLALILAINEMREDVDEEMLGRVLSMYGYLKSFMRFKTEKMAANVHIEYEDLILQAIHEIGIPASGRDITRKISSKKRQSADATNRTCKAMVETGVLTTYKVTPPAGSVGGRPKINYWFADREVPNA